MSDTTTTTEAATETEATNTEHEQATTEQAPKPTETVDFWKAKAREQEKRAKDNAAAAKRLTELEDAGKTETERLTARADQAEQAANDWQTKYHSLAKAQAITKAAADARAIDVDVITALIGNDIDIDDDGTVQGVDKAIRALAKAKPHLFNTTPAGARDAAATGTHQARTNPAQLFADAFQGRV